MKRISRRTWAMFCTGTGCMALVLIGLMWLRLQLQEPSNRSVCEKNLIGIRYLLRRYAAEHNGQYPTDLAELARFGRVDYGYMFVCPSSGVEPAKSKDAADMARILSQGTHLSYVYVRPTAMGPDAPARIVLYEPLSDHGGKECACCTRMDAPVGWAQQTPEW